jgi:hypothetical protein
VTEAATGFTEVVSARGATAAPRAAALTDGVNGAGADKLVSVEGGADSDD